MNLLNGALGGFSGTPSILKNPFEKSKIDRIFVHCYPDVWSKVGAWKFEATLSFTNGDTKGEQKIHGTSYPDLMNKVDSFIKTV